MKIKRDKHLYFTLPDEVNKYLHNLHVQKYIEREEDVNRREEAREKIRKIFYAKPENVFYFSDAAKQEASKIKLKNTDSYFYLRNVPDTDVNVILYNEKLYFKYYKADNCLMLLIFCMDGEGEKEEFRYFATPIYTDTGLLGNSISIEKEDLMVKLLNIFLQLITFKELTEVENINITASGKAIDKAGNKYVNNTNSDIRLINKAWNKNYILSPHMVEGHYRLQPCGEGRRDRKLIYVKDFMKGVNNG